MSFDKLQTDLDNLDQDTAVTLQMRFDPAGQGPWLLPLRPVRRDVDLQTQAIGAIRAQGGKPGEYELRLRAGSRYIGQARVQVHLPAAPDGETLGDAMEDRSSRVVGGGGSGGGSGGGGGGGLDFGSYANELGQRIIRQAVENTLSGPDDDDDDDDEDEDEEPSSSGSTLVQLGAAALQNPDLSQGLVRVVSALAGVVEGFARKSEAQARLYEGRALRFGGRDRAGGADARGGAAGGVGGGGARPLRAVVGSSGGRKGEGEGVTSGNGSQSRTS